MRFVIALVGLAGCVGQDDSADSSPTSGAVTVDVETTFMRLEGAPWELKEAIRPLATDGSLAELEPSLDWWAEYERLEPIAGGVEGIDVRLSGHRASLDRQVEELTGFLLSPATVGGRRAIVATGPDGAPATVSIELSGEYTVMALSFALVADELVASATELNVVTLEEWTAAGGQIVACAPPSTECPITTTD